MKKHLFLLFLILTFSLVLTGCSCSHNWQDATCTQARICTKCQLTEGDALGHDWQAASCAAAETCSRCAQTQGEPMAHTYGQWSFGQTDMTRSCQICGSIDSAEIDRELYLTQQLPGYWDFYAAQSNQQITFSHQLKPDTIAASLQIDFEKGSRWHESDGVSEVIPEFLSYEQAEGMDLYSFRLTFPADGYALDCLYVAQQNQILVPINGTQYYFDRNLALSQALTGYWGAWSNNSLAFLELKEDRSFVAQADGRSWSGTWHLRSLSRIPSFDPSRSHMTAYLDLAWESEGKTIVKTHMLNLGTEEAAIRETLGNNGFSLLLSMNPIALSRTDPQIMNLLVHAYESGGDRITGRWISSTVERYVNGSEKSGYPRAVTDYTMTFLEDGSFTAQMDQTYSGTWKFTSAVPASHGIRYFYSINIKGGISNLNIFLDPDGNLRLAEGSGQESYSITLVQYDTKQQADLEEANAGANTALLGEWTSFSVLQKSDTLLNAAYTLTFREDGTFLSNLEEGSSGTWNLAGVDISSGIAYSYNLELGSYAGSVSATINDSSHYLCLFLQQGADGKMIYFRQLNPQKTARLQTAANQIPGTWTWTDRSGEHTLTAAADRTFTSDMPGMTSGTWTYWLDEDDTIGYSFFTSAGKPFFCCSLTNQKQLILQPDEQSSPITMTQK